MGMLQYMAAGAVKSGADTYLGIRKEERADDREIKKEGRVDTIQQKAAKRLAEAGLAKQKNQQEFLTGEGKRNRDAAAELAKNKPITLSPQSQAYNPDGTLIAENPNAKPGSGDSAAKELLKNRWTADKFFDSKGRSAFGTFANNAYSFSDDKASNNAARASAIASKIWKRVGDRVDGNSIWAMAEATVRGKPSKGNERLKLLLDEKRDEWFISAEDKKDILAIEQEMEANKQNEWNTDLNQVPGGTGILSRNNDSPKPPAQDTATPPTHMLKEGVRMKFKNGQVWTLRGGKPTRLQ